MRLRVLNSSSSANGYILYNDSEALVIECGCTYSQCLRAIDFRRDKIVGALLTHEHGDHSKHIKQYLEAGIKVYTSHGTADALPDNLPLGIVEVENKQLFNVGGFKVMPFDTRHDCAQPFGFLIHHEETGQILFATDTFYLKYRFPNLSHVLLECNYENAIIDENVRNGVIPEIVKERVLRSHMSLDTCIGTLKANDLSKVNEIVLLHLSPHNSNQEDFKRQVEEATGKLVYVADKRLDIPFNRNLIQP